jgi:outer membrane scaffolding protein for murein synthesis (MipA/OmpV family)
LIPTALVAVLLSAGAARAADPSVAPLFSPEPIASAGWIVTLKVNAVAGPRFPGSDELGAIAYPSVSFRRVGEPRRFSTPDDGISFGLYETPAFRAGIVGRYVGGRYFETDRRLFGLDDVKWAVEPGLFVEAWPVSFLRARAELRRGINGHDGFVADLGLDLVQRFGAFTASIGPRLALGDGRFTRAYFGVTPGEAFLNGQVTPYRPSGGITSAGVAAALTYDWSERWSTTVHATYRRLTGDAADSPIVRRFGSENQVTLGASASYSFVTAGW